MLVYGDRSRLAPPHDVIDRLRNGFEALARMPAGIERHGRLVSLFIAASELAQGIADAEFAKTGFDRISPAQEAAMAVLVRLAEAIRASWESGFAEPLAFHNDALDALIGQPLPEIVELRSPEGYAFYAVFPESYLKAASGLDRSRPTKVIGIRSIGTGLAALVSAEVGAGIPLTVRPVGDPFRRELSVATRDAAALAADAETDFAVVDEGPGLSGSSFGAVADFLEDWGVVPERIQFFPSHAGDLGPQASPRHGERWRTAKRHVVDFDALVLRAPVSAHRLENWVTDLVGEPIEPLVDISGGAWRAHRFPGETLWPAAHLQQERRKFLLRAESGTWLLKFIGLGEEAQAKVRRAQALAKAGFCPPVAGYRHGFLVERWIDDATPLSAGDRPAVGRVAEYLAFRASNFPASAESGASLARLFKMARHNTRLGLGEEAASRLDRWAGRVATLEGAVSRAETDNRLHLWEWLRLPDGRVLKTDAVDHSAAHDLIGCQDVAWDVAGAVTELELSADEEAELHARLQAKSGRAIDGELSALLGLCYLAFQLGYCTLAAQSLAGFPEEARRLTLAAARYGARLRARLTEPS